VEINVVIVTVLYAAIALPLYYFDLKSHSASRHDRS